MPALFDRFAAIPGLLTTSSVCYTLLALHLSGYHSPESSLLWTRNHRTAVTILVQLFSQLFGIIHVFVVCALIRSSFLVDIATSPFRVSAAHFMQTFTSPRWSWGLSWSSTIYVLCMLGAAVAPAPIWAAALAPFPAERNMTTSIDIPSFEVSNVSTLWDADPGRPSFGANRQWTTEHGTFSYNTQIIRGGLLPSSQGASLMVDGKQKHAKLDRTGFSYLGRSFGAGAAAGFVNFDSLAVAQRYQFNETGIQASVHCFYNASASSYFTLVTQNVNTMKLYVSVGTGARGNSIVPISYASWLLQDLFAWTNGYDWLNHRSQIQIFTGANSSSDPYEFTPFQDVQCDIGYKLRTSTVMVNMSSSIISVQAQDSDELPWPAYGDAVGLAIDIDLYWITATDNCQNTGCTLDQSIVFNLNTLKNQTRDNSTKTILRATEEFVTSLVDNILINRLLTRFVSGAPQYSQQVEAVVVTSSIVFGDRKFIIIVCVLNTIIILAYFAECVRTRAWKATPPFDIMNDSEVIIAAFEGGRSFERNKNMVPSILDSRLQEDSFLKLHFNDSRSQKPILLPHATGMEYIPLPLEEIPTSYSEGSTPGGYFGVEERRLL